MKKAVIVGLLLVMALTGLGLGREIVVTSTADSGTGSFRWALATALSGDMIIFDPGDFPPENPATIYPRSELPPINCGNVIIDASNAGVVIDGSKVPGDWSNGLQVYSDHNTVMGLQIVNFAGSGIAVCSGSHNTIGGDRGIGSGPLGQGNLVSKNDIGIDICDYGTSYNIVRGNLIGTDVSGTAAWGNRERGVWLEEPVHDNTIGPDNTIAYNGIGGIAVSGGGPVANTITRNSIHSNGVFGILLNEDGNGSLPAASVASADSQAGNLSGNTCANCIVEIFSDRGSEGAIYEGRAIADANGDFSFEKGKPFAGPNVTLTATTVNDSTSGFTTAVSSTNTPSIAQKESPRELVVTSTADSGMGSFRWALQVARSGDTITFDPEVFPPDDPATIYPRSELPPISCGHLTIDASNAGVIIDGFKVPGDWNNGLQVYSNYNTVMGLQIVNFAGSGIVVGGAKQNTIGGDRSTGSGPIGQGNLTSGNSIGINLCDVGTSHNVILGNLVGIRAGGTTPCGNRTAGVFIESGAIGNIIGPNNIIAHNLKDGVTVMRSDSYGNTITRNSIYENGVGIYIMDTMDIALREGGNAGLPTPVISEFYIGSGTLTGTAAPGSTIEIFSGHRQGEVYEGTAISDAAGSFSFRKAAPLSGPYLTCTATDSAGNTSSFSMPMAVTSLQEGSTLSRTLLHPKESRELADNRIGSSWNGFWQPIDMAAVVENGILNVGLKRAMLTINACEAVTSGKIVVDLTKSEFVIEPNHDVVFSIVASNGVQITYSLVFWDKDIPTTEDVLSGPRFKTEDQILRYLDFVRFIVRHFKDRVQRFEIWGEPNVDMPGLWGKHIDFEDYIELVRRIVPVIREEYSEAKIHVGATSGLREESSQAYMFEVLRSDIMPLVDVVTWHPLYGESPENEASYYYDYPSIVQEIKDLASSHGFQGEYEADEVTWWTQGEENDAPWRYSNTQAAKYYARAILQHLGMDVSICIGGSTERPVIFQTVRNLCTVMAGHESIDMPAQIDIDYDGPVAYCAFRYPNGDRILAVWTDGVAQDDDPGVPATITIPDLVAGTVTGIDVLNGFEQELNVETDNGSTVIRDLLVKDYPILIRLSDVTMSPDYVETVGDGFHRLGDVNAMPSSTGSGSDRDGDGVPDDEDYCPDWPGSKEANGC